MTKQTTSEQLETIDTADLETVTGGFFRPIDPSPLPRFDAVRKIASAVGGAASPDPSTNGYPL